MELMKCQKQLFEIPTDITYLNAAYMGPSLKRSAAIGKVAVDQKLHPWEITTNSFFDLPNKVCALFGNLIGTYGENIALIPSASYGIGVAAKNCRVDKGHNIVVLEDQFPSNFYPWKELANKNGAEINIVPRPEDDDWTTSIVNTIDERTSIVACGQVHWTNGTIIDLVQVSQKCKKVGAALVLDLTQSMGVMPFALKKVDPDFIVVSSYKWLLGPYSFGYMYVAPRHHAGSPLEENWIARKDSENFAGLVDYKDDYQPGARRFDMGERANFIHAPMAITALELFNELGVNNIANYIKYLTDYCAEQTLELGLSIVNSKFRSPHLIGLDFKNGVPGHIAPTLAAHKIFVSVRGRSIRVAPHIYNDKNDIDRLFGILKSEL